jgi:predicted GNAT family acetyltransferase
MTEWQIRKGDPAPDPVSLARAREVVEYEIDGHPFVFSCAVVPNEWDGRGVAVMMELAELERADHDPIRIRHLAAAFVDDELPGELDLATIVTCRTRTEGLFESAVDILRATA